jgi:signal transduction histidine kinase
MNTHAARASRLSPAVQQAYSTRPAYRQATLWLAYIIVAVVVIVGVYSLLWLWQVKSLGVTINWTGELLSVEPGTLADRAELRPGDHVRFEDFQRLKRFAGEASVGQLVDVEVTRDGAPRIVTLQATPNSFSRLVSVSVEPAVGILFALLGIAPLVARRRGFSLWLFFAAVQLTALYLITDVPRAYHQLWAEIIAYVTLPLFPAAVFHFHTLFPEPRLGRWRRPLVMLVYGVAAVLLPLDLISIWNYGFYVSDAWQYVISVYQALVLLACVGLVLRTYATNRDPNVRRQLRIVTMCIAVGLLIPALVVVPVVMFDLDTSDTLKSITIFAALVVPAGYAYSMVRYKLLIGGLLWRPGLIKVIYTSLLSLGLVVFVVFALERDATLSGNASLVAWTGMVLVVVALAGLHEWLGRWTETHLFKGGSYVDLLASATDELTRFRQLEDYVSFFTTRFPTRLRSIGSLVFLTSGSDGALRLQAYSPGLRLQVPEENMPSLPQDSELGRNVEAAGGPVALATLLMPHALQLGESDTQLLGILSAARVEWLLPLVSSQRSQLIGMVALGRKETDEAYSPQEVTALAALARTASISAENVLMFEALQNRVTELDQEREFSAALARDLSEAQEKERSRISDDIHDAVLQDLSVALRLLARLRDELQQVLGGLEDTEIALDRLDAPVEVSGQTTSSCSVRIELRNMLHECQAMLGSLLGENPVAVGNWEPGTDGKAAAPSARQLEQLHDTSGRCLVEGILSLVRSTNQRLREICTNLHPAYLDVPLVKTLSRSIHRLDQVSPGVKIEMKVRGREPANLGHHVKYLCKKITEQAIHNALEHAMPSSIAVEVAFPDREAGEGMVALCVTDDGTGFEPRTPRYWRTTDHHGLASMYEAATLVGGTLEIASAPGRGTRVHLCVPLKWPGEQLDGTDKLPGGMAAPSTNM